MIVYGVDFSGAKDPSGKIHIVRAELHQDEKIVRFTESVACDDRLDLFASIVHSEPDSVWGLDVPFAPPSPAYERIGFSEWSDWLQFAASTTREQFMQQLEAHFPAYESACRLHGWACRHTDIAAQAASVFKRVQPNLRSMIYAGWKLLAYARRFGVRVYPFDGVEDRDTPCAPTLYEIYPSHTARLATKRRTLDVMRSADWVRGAAGLRDIELPERLSLPASQDAADAFVACLTLAAVMQLHAEPLRAQMPVRPLFALEAEWAEREREGLIVRLPFA